MFVTINLHLSCVAKENIDIAFCVSSHAHSPVKEEKLLNDITKPSMDYNTQLLIFRFKICSNSISFCMLLVKEHLKAISAICLD